MRHLHLPSALVALCALLLSGVAHAQLSGSYTIDPNGTGPRNYTSFAAASTALASPGVSGPTTFNVAAGTFVESWTIPAIPGASATNTVTFKAVAVPPVIYLTKLTGGASHIIDILPGANHVIIDGFEFTSTSNGVAIQSIATGNSSSGSVSNIEIANCRFGSGIAGDSRGRQHIYVEGRSASNSWIIRDCEFQMGAKTYGCYLSQVRFWLIHRNRINVSGTSTGLYWINTNDARNVMANNLFTGTTSTSSSACLINIAASNTNNDVCCNTFDVTTSGSVIRCFGHNNPNFNRINGNIFNVQGTGVCINVTIASLAYWDSDGNLFNAPGGYVGQIVSTKYKSLASWIQGSAGYPHGAQDTNSVTGNPMFVSATDWHLTAGSPALGKGIRYAGRHDPVEDMEGWLRGTKPDIGAFELTAYRPYDDGCPGTGNQVPGLSIGGNIAPSENISFDLGNGRPNSTTAMGLGLTKVNVPFGTGCNLLVNPLILLFLQTDGSGVLSLPATIPASTSILGTEIHLQAAVSDAAAAGGLAFTSGITIRM